MSDFILRVLCHRHRTAVVVVCNGAILTPNLASEKTLIKFYLVHIRALISLYHIKNRPMHTFTITLFY